MTQTLTIKNIGKSPTHVYSENGQVPIGPGETVTDVVFSDAEGRTVNANRDVFDVTGYVEPEGGVKQDHGIGRDENGDTPEMALMRKQFNDRFSNEEEVKAAIRDELNKGTDKIIELRGQLKDIANLFDTDEVDELNVHAAVERLLQDHAELLESTTAPKPTLADAVAKLDDANDDHWTQAGQPKLSALAKLFGGDASAADYAALPDDAKRVRKS